jgi:hypothetical protein
MFRDLSSLGFPFWRKGVNFSAAFRSFDMRELLDDLVGLPELLKLDRGMGPGYSAGLGDAVLGYIKRDLVLSEPVSPRKSSINWD